MQKFLVTLLLVLAGPALAQVKPSQPVAPLNNPEFGGTVKVDRLQIQGLGSTGPISDMSFNAPFEGSRPVSLKDRIPAINARDCGAVPNTDIDQAPAINTCLQRAFEQRRPFEIEKGYYGVGQSGVAADGRPYALLSKAVTMYGVGSNTTDTVIYPLASVANNVDILRIEAPANLGENFSLSDIMINPGVTGSLRGGVGIFMVNLEQGNLSMVSVDNMRVTRGNDYSLYIKGVPSALTPQGAFANSRVTRSVFDDGVKGEGLGDSILWQGVAFRNHSTARAAVDYGVTNFNPDFPAGLANLASVQTFDNCNFGSLGPIAILRNGRHYVFRNPNMEIGNESGATGGENNVMLDVRGDVGPIARVEIQGGQMGLFGDGTARKMIRLGRVQNFRIAGTTMASGLAPGLTTGIDITSDATDTSIYALRTNGNNFASFITDNGVGTMGVRKVLPLATGMTAASGLQAPSFIKDETGLVRLYGTVETGSTAGPVLLATLPPGFRPAVAYRLGVILTGATVTTLDVFTDGRINYNGPANQQVNLNGVSYQNNPTNVEAQQNH